VAEILAGGTEADSINTGARQRFEQAGKEILLARIMGMEINNHNSPLPLRTDSFAPHSCSDQDETPGKINDSNSASIRTAWETPSQGPTGPSSVPLSRTTIL
jgi:hypothetical protein